MFTKLRFTHHCSEGGVINDRNFKLIPMAQTLVFAYKHAAICNLSKNWEKSYDHPREHKKSRDITLPTKVCLVKAMFFFQ